MAKPVKKAPDYERRSASFQQEADAIVRGMAKKALKTIEELNERAEVEANRLAAAKYICKLSGLEIERITGEVNFVPIKISRLYRDEDDE